MVMQKVPTIFETDLFLPLLTEDIKKVGDRTKRIILDHVKASVLLISDGIIPSNKDQGYVLRRFIRRVMIRLSKQRIHLKMSLMRLIYILEEILKMERS